MTKNNIIIFSSIDWSTHWQIHHQLTTSLSNSGNRVLFIENTGVRSPELKDLGRIKERIQKRINSIHGFQELNENTTLFSPIFVPYPFNNLAIYLNILLTSNAIKSWIKRANFDNFIVISFLPTPSTQGIIRKISPILTLYYCADDMSRTLINSSKLRDSENRMFDNSDLVLTTSNKIYKRASILSRSVHYIPAGVDIDKFVYSSVSQPFPENIKSLKRPIIGYIGAISDVLDKDLIVDMANSIPDATILLIGPLFTEVPMFNRCNNITILGEVPHDQISTYVQCFDVAIIPYLINEFTDSVYPCKLNEYLAMGLPVISSNLQEICLFEEKYQGSVMIGKNTSDFIIKVEEKLNNDSAKSHLESEKRVQIAKENTWGKRFIEIDNAIKESLELKSKRKVNWKEDLTNYYTSRRSRFIKRLILIFSLYFLIFYSPLAWYMGEQLVVRDTLVKSDAIVVFSGNGEASYHNTSYQRRALDAVSLYSEGYAKSIYISSGIKQTISEVEMIRLFLTSKGVPENAIFMLEKYPNSTYMNVFMVKEMLDKNNINSIIFITSPYHSLRAQLTWEKNAPYIDIVSPPVVDTPASKAQWAIGFDKIKIISYEYLALIHNWFNGRI